MTSFITSTYPLFAWIGSLAVLLGILVSAFVYRGKTGEKYSIFNHFISELGERGVSKLAIFFNVGMMIGGLAFVPVMIGLGLVLGSWWGILGMLCGVVAAVACFFVGVFPMDNMKPHGIAAMTYFRMGLVTILLFTVAIFVQPAASRQIPLAMNIAGILSIAAYAAFLVVIGIKTQKNKAKQQAEALDTSETPDRPRFWILALLEWLVFFTTMLWFIGVAVFG